MTDELTKTDREWREWVTTILTSTILEDFSSDRVWCITSGVLNWGWWGNGGGWILTTQLGCVADSFVELRNKLDFLHDVLIQEDCDMKFDVSCESDVPYYAPTGKRILKDIGGYSYRVSDETETNYNILDKDISKVTEYEFRIAFFRPKFESRILDFKKFNKNKY